MKLGTLIKYGVGLGSLCISAWQMPQLMDKFAGGGAGAGNTAGGAAALLGALNGSGVSGSPAATNPLLAALGGSTPAAQAPGAPPKPAAEPAKPEDFVVFSADGSRMTPAQREEMLRRAAKAAPLKPGATKPGATPRALTNSKGKVSSIRSAKGAPNPADQAQIDAQALEDITRQLQAELQKSGTP